ncbi:hypothetical protein FVEG_11752 [Fusarium verticillioides 7600]|uniref:Uncharacterized protein n=1 Tax=Gibberella moniliformis (strain M3125 / FGSC 7600) TaxID=334819 RepID=W7MZP8_GIBM7|nr:hypothetical protein FVEG_11752 [Fusarium verticillioides 7600]EWG53289.1 hypothetical protein FVEG_11752 [Fusarium verticillioides 7600]
MSRVSSSRRSSRASSYLRRSTSENDGSWLSAPGPYRDLIRSLCASRPDLRSRDETNESDWPPTCYNPRIVALEVQGNSVHECLETSDPRELDQHFQEYKAKKSAKRRIIYILEGLNPEFISILGGHLMIHPILFTDHLWWKSVSSTGHNIDNIALAISAQDYICFEYPENFWLNADDNSSYQSNCLKTGRIIIKNVLEEDYVSLTVDRKCSFWSSMLSANGGWNAVILCDPPPLVIGPEENEIFLQPRASGYNDILAFEDQIECLTGPPRTSMFDDLHYYLKRHSSYLNLEEPSAPTFFIENIVLQHFLQQHDVLKIDVLNIQYRMANSMLETLTPADLEAHRYNGHCDEINLIDNCDKLSRVIGRLSQLNPRIVSGNESWKDPRPKFEALYRRFQDLLQQCRAVNSSIAGLVSLVHATTANKEAIASNKEAKRARVLVLVGLVFVPLSLASSLFSMAEPYSPGHSHFWVYFAVSLPLAIATVAIYFIYDLRIIEHLRK